MDKFRNQSGAVDYATIFGVTAAFSLVFMAISLGGGIASFLDLKSFLIVIGGTVGATLVNFPLEEFQKSFSVIKATCFSSTPPAITRIRKVLDMSRRVRANGALILENDTYRESDSFIKKCIELVVDGHPPSEIRRILEIEIAFLEERHRRGAQLFQTMGSVAPAMGLIGTLIGLVQMLENLEDPSQIGPAMAVALLTTFYGALMANIIFLPLSGKLRARSEEERFIKETTLEGIVGIAEGAHPKIIEQRMLSFIPPDQRHVFNAER